VAFDIRETSALRQQMEALSDEELFDRRDWSTGGSKYLNHSGQKGEAGACLDSDSRIQSRSAALLGSCLDRIVLRCRSALLLHLYRSAAHLDPQEHCRCCSRTKR
jgi:hypothetical protein